MHKRTIGNALVYIGLKGIAVGLLTPLLMGPWRMTIKVIYSASAVLLLVGRLLTPLRTNNLRVKRLDRFQVWSAIFFCAAAVFLWLSRDLRDWLAFTLAGGVVQLMASIMLWRQREHISE